MEVKVKLTNVVLGAFPALLSTTSYKGGDPYYACKVHINKDDPQMEDLHKSIKDLAAEVWGATSETILKQVSATGKSCLRDGDLTPEYPGCEGTLILSSRCKPDAKPAVFNRARERLYNVSENVFYPGCKVNILVAIWAQNVKGAEKQLNAKFLGIQFVEDGPSLMPGTVVADEDFPVLDVPRDPLLA